MATARVLDGKGLAGRLREEVRREAAEIAAGGLPPALSVLLVGSDPASETYVAAKTRAAREAGCLAETVRLPAAASPEKLLAEIDRINRDPEIDGVLVQLPLPPGHDARRVCDRIHPLKDVDGLHPENVGRLVQGRPRFVPCTPAGILALLKDNEIGIAGARAVVVGRSDIVGKPLAALLTAGDATVTLCHSRSPELAATCREADLLVVAVGKPLLVTADFVKARAVVIDVGVNRIAPAEANRRPSIVGDVDFDSVSRVAGWITPVPGGVGPLTVAMLLKNTVLAARLRDGRL